MMKNWQVLLLSVWLNLIISVPVIQSQNSGISRVGKTQNLQCNSSSAVWVFGNVILSDCGTCQKPICDTKAEYKDRFNVSCDKANNIGHLTIANLTTSDTGKYSCGGKKPGLHYQLYVGDRSEHFRTEDNSSLLLDQSKVTLVCDRDLGAEMVWYNGSRQEIGRFGAYSCVNTVKPSGRPYSDRGRFLCDQSKNVITFEINPITVDLDAGTTIGCRNGDQLYLYDFKVKAHVQTVTLERLHKSTPLLEGRREAFRCVAERSSRPATVWWFIVVQNGSEIRILDPSHVELKLKGKVGDTISTLDLLLQRGYQQIVCQATIDGTTWKKSSYVSLNVLYASSGKPVITMEKPVLCVGDRVRVNCQWNVDFPDVLLKLSCLSRYSERKSNVTVEGVVTKDMDGSICRCDGVHIARNDFATTEIEVYDPPTGVTISQTSYLEGETTTLTCKAIGGNMAAKKITWLPGSHHDESIHITLNRTHNKDMYTCSAHFECHEKNPLVASIHLNVEYKPHIKTKVFRVIENRTYAIRCEAEGNPDPKVTWVAGVKAYNSPMLNTSFTRHNASHVFCVATGNSSRYGLLRSIQRVSILVSYSPEITLVYDATRLHRRAYLKCKADANPPVFAFKMIQRWGNVVKREIKGDFVEFSSFSREDFGTWTCQASNGVPTKHYYTEKSMELQMPVPPLIQGNSTETAVLGPPKSLKLCFYCYPEATDITWFKDGERISSDRYSFGAADDGLFPFFGKCSLLEVSTIDGTLVHNFSFVVTNAVGQTSFPVVLQISQPDDSIEPGLIMYPTLIYVLAASLVVVIIGAAAAAIIIKSKIKMSVTIKSKTKQPRCDMMQLATYEQQYLNLKGCNL